LPIPPNLLNFARQLRKEQTDAEALLWHLLRGRRFCGFKFRRQYPIGGYILDFYCHDAGLAIELDGGGHNHEEQRRYDEERTKAIEGTGIRLIRFWNHDLLNSLEDALEEIYVHPLIRPAATFSLQGEGLILHYSLSMRERVRVRGQSCNNKHSEVHTMRIQPFIATLTLLCTLALPAAALAGTISATDKYAWSENTGWLNFGPSTGGVTVHSTYLAGYAWQQNIGWIKLGANAGGPYANTGAANWGVNRDSAGNLSGYAWSETMGWINFAASHGGVTINPVSGSFDGYAWGANIGWISFRSQSGAPVAYGVGLESYTLTLSFDGNGAGSVVSQSPSFSCNTGCPQQFLDITQLTLTANPAEYSQPNVLWNGCDSVVGAVCSLKLDRDRPVKVTFTRNTAYTARIEGAPPAYYPTLQKAYDAAVTGNVIEVWGIDLPESITCGAGAAITIRGGYDQPYQNQSGVTSLQGLTIGKGAVTVDGIVVK
jgi:very-short-patch-repair endonuclease